MHRLSHQEARRPLPRRPRLRIQLPQAPHWISLHLVQYYSAHPWVMTSGETPRRRVSHLVEQMIEDEDDGDGHQDLVLQ